MDYKLNRNLCIVLTILCVVCPTSLLIPYFTNQFIWFVYLYVLMGFFMKYKDAFSQEKIGRIMKVINRFYIFVVCGVYALMAYLVFLSEKFFPLHNSGSALVLVAALGIFFFFIRLNIGHNSFINWVAKGTFVAYLIHENYFVRDCIWNDVLKCSGWYNSPSFFFYGFLSIIAILLIAAFVTVVVDKMAMFVLNRSTVKQVVTKLDAIF